MARSPTPARLPAKTAGTVIAGGTLSIRAQVSESRDIMNLRYVVVRREDEWKIVQGGRRHSGSYPSQRQAVGAAIAIAERDGHVGRRVEVLVRQEDGHFSTEWIFGRDLHSDASARPILTPHRK
jgi:hypothetical protein